MQFFFIYITFSGLFKHNNVRHVPWASMAIFGPLIEQKFDLNISTGENSWAINSSWHYKKQQQQQLERFIFNNPQLCLNFWIYLKNDINVSSVVRKLLLEDFFKEYTGLFEKGCEVKGRGVVLRKTKTRSLLDTYEESLYTWECFSNHCKQRNALKMSNSKRSLIFHFLVSSTIYICIFFFTTNIDTKKLQKYNHVLEHLIQKISKPLKDIYKFVNDEVVQRLNIRTFLKTRKKGHVVKVSILIKLATIIRHITLHALS